MGGVYFHSTLPFSFSHMRLGLFEGQRSPSRESGTQSVWKKRISQKGARLFFSPNRSNARPPGHAEPIASSRAGCSENHDPLNQKPQGVSLKAPGDNKRKLRGLRTKIFYRLALPLLAGFIPADAFEPKILAPGAQLGHAGNVKLWEFSGKAGCYHYGIYRGGKNRKHIPAKAAFKISE